MRVLALHGVGSSATMLREQLGSLMNELGPGYQFTFLEGAIPCERGPGMPEWTPGPFRSYTTGYSPNEVREALDDLDEFLQGNGPFDGFIGFSQGASVGAAYILDYQRRLPKERPPFKFAVFFSSVGACSPDATCCEDLVRSLLGRSSTFRDSFPYGDLSSIKDPMERAFIDYLSRCAIAIKSIGIKRPIIPFHVLKDGDAGAVPRLLHPVVVEDRISIPTVHVTGKKDLPSMVHQSNVVQGLCSPDFLRVHRHAGGHGLPTKKSDVRAVVESIEWAIRESDTWEVLRQL